MNILKKMLILCFIMVQIAVFSQETYTAKMTKTKIKIGKGIDKVWSNAQTAKAVKSVSYMRSGVELTNDMNPAPADYSLEFGALWDAKGIYILVKIVDEKIVREFYQADDPYSDWSRDDCIGFLFDKNHNFESKDVPVEFAWLVKKTQEAKATLKFGVNKKDVVTEWTVDKDNVYYAEIFIAWSAFKKSVKAGDKIPFEIRGRDDDGGGLEGGYPQSFLQWSTSSKDVEKEGAGLGTIILSGEIVK